MSPESPRPGEPDLTEAGPTDDDVVEGELVEPDPEPVRAEDLGLDLPDDPDEAIELLLTELDEARNEAGAYLDDLKRVAADFENFRRRTLKEQTETTHRAAEKIVRDLLPALDSFDAALAVEPSTEAEEKLLAGMHRTHEQLLTILKSQGLEVVPTFGERFDPEVHEAVMAAPDGDGELIVKEELRRGYTLNGRLIRAALVALERES